MLSKNLQCTFSPKSSSIENAVIVHRLFVMISDPSIRRSTTLDSFRSDGTDRHLEVCKNQYDRARKEFLAVLDKFTRKAVCGRPFILIRKLKRTLETSRSAFLSDSESLNFKSDFDRLWKSSFFRLTAEPPDVSEEKLSRCTSLFFLLVELDLPELTPHFLHNGIDDKALPLDRATLCQKIGDASATRPQRCNFTADAWAKFTDDFLAKQYRWCPVKLELNLERRDVGRQVLPFYEKIAITSHDRPSANGSTLWMIEVPEDFVETQLAEELPDAKRLRAEETVSFPSRPH